MNEKVIDLDTEKTSRELAKTNDLYIIRQFRDKIDALEAAVLGNEASDIRIISLMRSFTRKGQGKEETVEVYGPGDGANQYEMVGMVEAAKYYLIKNTI